MKLGLIIDLTNTNRFYDKAEVENRGIGHVKLRCQGLVKMIQTNTFPFIIFFAGKFQACHSAISECRNNDFYA